MKTKKELNKEVLGFLRTHPECVLATVSASGKPEAATVLFAVDDDFNFYFGTRTDYRKYMNLVGDKWAAVVVGASAKDPRTVQAEGKMAFLARESDIGKAKMLFRMRNPAMIPFFSMPLVYMRLTPLWLRFLDETKGGADNFEQVIP